MNTYAELKHQTNHGDSVKQENHREGIFPTSGIARMLWILSQIQLENNTIWLAYFVAQN